MKSFINFIQSQGVIGIAIGFLLGGAVSKVVTSLVNDIINPLLGIVLGATGNLADFYIKIGKAEIRWGRFTNNLIDFLIIAAIVYSLIQVFRLNILNKKNKEKGQK